MPKSVNNIMPFGIDFWTPNVIRKAPKIEVQGDSAAAWGPSRLGVPLRVALGTDFKRFLLNLNKMLGQLFDYVFLKLCA